MGNKIIVKMKSYQLNELTTHSQKAVPSDVAKMIFWSTLPLTSGHFG
jgi:hypothetical protein